jgi:hypothetical protein
MRIALALLLLAHGVAHVVGFIRAWAPTRTTIVGDRVDLGPGWIKLIGILWLFGALLFAAAGFATLANVAWWPPFALALATSSLVLCMLQLPETKLGVVLNLVLIGVLVGGHRIGWF